MSRLLLCILMSLPAAAMAEVYRWVDAEGVVHYSDQPAANAERADLPALQPTKPPPSVDRQTPSPGQANSQVDLRLSQPLPGATFRDARGIVPVSAALNQPLTDNLRLVYYLDGQPVANSPTRKTSVQLAGVARGEHRVRAALLRGDRQIAAAEAVTFYMKPPTALTPLNQTAPQPDSSQPAGAPTPPVIDRSGAAPAAPRFDTGR